MWNASPPSVSSRFSRRAGIPAPVHAQPLVGIAAHVVFDNPGKQLGISNDVFLVVSGTQQFDRGIKAQAVFSQRGVPDGKGGNHGRVGAQRDPGQSAGGAGGGCGKEGENTLRGGASCVARRARRTLVALAWARDS